MHIFSNADFLNQTMRFNSFLMIVNFIVIAGFSFSYIKMYKKTGRVIDYWNFVSIQFFIIPVFLMYPFSASSGNIIATGNAYYKLEPYVNIAYVINLVGYVSFLIGGDFAGTKSFKISDNLIGFFEALNNRFVIVSFSMLLVVLVILFIFFQFMTGNIGDPRSFFMSHNKYRPVYNFIISYFKIIVVLLGAFFIDKREKFSIFLLAVILCLGVALGTRSSLLDSICYVFFMFFMVSGKKVNMWHAAVFAFFMVVAVLMLGALRSGHLDKILANLIYGNTFSDTRDFAWILSYWDFDYVYGKTYLSGLISFIPSSVSDYREFWAISRYTNRFVGFDSLVHPGLRSGKFGEPFFNFGFIGVSFLGVVLGYVLKKTSNGINNIVDGSENKKAVKIFILTIPFQFVSMFCLTSGFFELYVFAVVILGMIIFYWAARKIIKIK